MTLAENIKRLRKDHGYTQNDLAKILNVSPNSISAWEVGRNKPLMDKVTIMAKLFGVKTSEIIGDDILAENVTPIVNFTRIPLLGVIACGEPILAEENIDSYVDQPTANLPKGNLFYLRAKGDSMKPTIPNGSLVLIRQQSDVESGEIAAVLFTEDTEATLKRIKKVGETIILLPDNPEYEPMVVDDSHPARILGKAVQVTSIL